MNRVFAVPNYSAEIVKPSALSDAQKQAWEDFRRSNHDLYSPYFYFGYTDMLSTIRDDVYVLVVSDTDKPIAFLPFQALKRSNGKIGFARNIGAPMTDYQGIICAPKTYKDSKFDIIKYLEQADISAFGFSAFVNIPNGVVSREEVACTVLDISGGAEEWRKGRSSSYRRHLKSTRRRIRKSEEIGKIKTVFKCKDEDVFDQLIAWKKQKFVLTGKYDVLSAGWAETLLRNLWQMDGDGLRAEMHALYFGNELAAIDLGLTDGDVFHSWMVGYNDDFHQLAPGIQLLEALIDAAGDLGYQRIDLGEGIDGYKRHYASEDVRVASGYIATAGLAASFTRFYGGLENFTENKLGKMGKAPGKLRRRYSQIRACEQSSPKRVMALLAAFKGAPK